METMHYVYMHKTKFDKENVCFKQSIKLCSVHFAEKLIFVLI